MLYILLRFATPTTGGILPHEPDTRRREPDAASNPERAQGQEAAKIRRPFSSRCPASAWRSLYSYASMQEAIKAAEALRRQNKQAIRPFVPAALRSEPALELPPQELAGPKGVMVHPFSAKEPEKGEASGQT